MTDRAEATDFSTLALEDSLFVVAPDGAGVRVLLGLPRGSWLVLSGRGEMWRKQGAREEMVALEPGVCLTIPLGTRFQFRAAEGQALAAVAVTMPPWPGDGEAFAVAGPWQPRVGAHASPSARSTAPESK